MSDRVDAPFVGYGDPCNCVSMLNNGVPTQVQIFLGANDSKNALTTGAGFVDDTWRLSRRNHALARAASRSLSTGPARAGRTGGAAVRGDRPGADVQQLGAARRASAADLTGDGKTVLKLHYGKFWVYPAPIFVAAFNPNASGWSRTHQWTNDANANGRWDPGEEGAVTSVSAAAPRRDSIPEIDNAYVTQASAYLEREVSPDVGVRTGVVLNARRQWYGTINISRPLDAYAVPVSIVDPGPDGRPGTADDGATLTARQLTAESLAAAR